jgi:serine/threonine-protein kinase
MGVPPRADDPTVELGAAPGPGAPLAGWDRYGPLELIGEGGMGRVFRGHDPRLQRPVALKFLARTDPHGRFLREARLQASVVHENICRVYEVGEVGGVPYIAMQLIDGAPLSEVVSELSLDDKVRIVESVAAAVQAAHKQGLVHRDLKPGNVMVERGPAGWKPYVMDFGLARELDAPTVTATGQILGTPAFMAPEQAHGAAADVRTDVYGLGATLYFLLTGRPPYSGSSAQVLARVLDSEPARPRALAPHMPAELEIICARCMERAPERRYLSAWALVEDLRRFRAGEPIAARRVGVVRRLRQLARRHRLVTTAVVVGLVAGLVPAALWLRERTQAARRAELARRFGGKVERMRDELRRSYLLPAHDLRPERRALEQRLGDLAGDVEGLGDVARGPGEEALGEGWLSLGQAERARAHLEAAWSAGERDAGAAYALGAAYGAVYRGALHDLDRVADDGERERRRREAERSWREPALRYLRLGEGGDDPDYALAALAFYEERWDEARVRAQVAFTRAPWLYEARVLGGEIGETRARARFYAGDHEGAVALAAAALDDYRAAAEIARSDARVYVGLCRTASLLTVIDLRRGQPPEAHRDQAIAACQQARAIDDDVDEARLVELEARAAWALTELRRRHDPGPACDAVDALASDIVGRGSRASDPHRARGNCLRTRGVYLGGTGGDPRPLLIASIASLAVAARLEPRSYFNHNDLAVCWAQLAEVIAPRGGDARMSLDHAVGELASAAAIDPANLVATQNRASLLVHLGALTLEHGADPRPTLIAATELLERVATRSPEGYFEADLGHAHLLLAEHTAAIGGDPAGELAVADEAVGRSLAKRPGNKTAELWRARVALFRAQIALERGADVGAALARARAASTELIGDGAGLAHEVATLAEVELLASRAAAQAGQSPEPALAAAERALATSRDTTDPRLALATIELERRRAEWLRTKRRDVGSAVAAGLAVAARGAGRTDPLFLARTGALELVDAEVRADPERAARAAADLDRALAASPLLLAAEFTPLARAAAARAAPAR